MMLSILQSVFLIVLNAAWATVSHCLVLLGPFLFLLWGIHQTSRLIECRGVYMFKGMRFYQFTVAGIIIHEIGHAVFHPLFGHKIGEITFFDFETENYMLGSVASSHDDFSVRQNIGLFFIGIGPIVFGSIVIVLLGNWLLNGVFKFDIAADVTSNQYWDYLLDVFINNVKLFFSSVFMTGHLTDWHFYLFLYFAFSIGANMGLSDPDLKGAFPGLTVIVVLLFFFNLTFGWHLADAISAFIYKLAIYFVKFLSILSTVLILNTLMLCVMLLIPAPKVRGTSA